MGQSKARVITFANIKGGVGKTTAIVNIAYLLGSEFKKRVLVIDADDQGNATKALGVREGFDLESQTLWAALYGKLSYKKAMVKSPYENIWVIPASKELKRAQLAFGQSARGLKMIRRLLSGVEKDFDFILIDTKPQINILLQSSLSASDGYVVPSFPEPDSYDGFIDLLTECEEICEEENSLLRCYGILFTNVKNSPAHTAYIEFIKGHLAKAKIPIFNALIRHSNAIATGGFYGCPAVSLSNSRNSSDDYREATQQLLKKIAEPVRKRKANLKQLGIQSIDSFVPQIDLRANKDAEINF